MHIGRHFQKDLDWIDRQRPWAGLQTGARQRPKASCHSLRWMAPSALFCPAGAGCLVNPPDPVAALRARPLRCRRSACHRLPSVAPPALVAGTTPTNLEMMMLSYSSPEMGSGATGHPDWTLISGELYFVDNGLADPSDSGPPRGRSSEMSMPGRFSGAIDSFHEFLAREGRPQRIEWLFREDVAQIGHRTFIRVPPPAENHE